MKKPRTILFACIAILVFVVGVLVEYILPAILKLIFLTF